MSGRTAPATGQEVRALVAALPDPELPMINLGDLGVIGAVALCPDGELEVEVMPTYLGCPALTDIVRSVERVLAASGHPRGRVRQVLSPPWTTDRITAAGRATLAASGIAPPAPTRRDGPVPVQLSGVHCPHCGSRATRLHSAFGPARCQSMLWCTACRDLFPHLTPL